MNAFSPTIYLQPSRPAYPAPLIVSSAQMEVLARNANKGILKMELVVQFTTAVASANFALRAQSTHV
jgi:hypothetical protein